MTDTPKPASEAPKVFGPFNGLSKSGRPIALKNGFPAWACAPPPDCRQSEAPGV